MFSIAAEFILLQDIKEEQVLTTLDLYSEEKQLGTGEGGLQRITESQVTIGQPEIEFVPQTQRTDGDIWDYYGLYQPFTLHRLEGERYCQLLVFQITMNDVLVKAIDLFPKNVTMKLDIEDRIAVTPQLKFSFKVIEAGGEVEREIKKQYTTLIPIITVYGEGEREFYWEYKAGEEQPVFTGVKQAAVVLRVPRGTTEVTGTILYKAVIIEKILGGILKVKNAKTGRYPITWWLHKQ